MVLRNQGVHRDVPYRRKSAKIHVNLIDKLAWILSVKLNRIE